MVVIFRTLDLSLPEHCMFLASFNLAYFRFCHSAQFTVPNLASFSPAIHLGVADIASILQGLPRAHRQGRVSSVCNPFSTGVFVSEGK